MEVEFEKKNDETREIVLKDNNEKSHSIKYRADIDGLRSIAIGIVLIFHAWPKSIVGGFIGVDVFFVISGFLISSIIFREYEENKFSYLNFYFRRIKRLFPALIILIFSVLLIAYYQLWDNEITALSKTIIAGSLFGANLQILFLKQGYFDADTQKNPLLHLWSLGVEEQFYLIWPLVAYLLIGTSQKKSYILIGGFFCISFILNIIAVYSYTSWAYYFPLCRFWEMVIGGLIALMDRHKIKFLEETNNFKNNLVSICGLLLILIFSLIINENSAFPGFWAIFPTLGAALLILSKNGLINEYLLSSKLCVFIGKISYPLYLWHWPILVFGKIILRNFPDFNYPIIFLVFLSIALSIMTYFLIEKPTNLIKSKKKISTLLISGMSLVLLFGVLYLSFPVYFSRLSYLRQNLLSNITINDTETNSTDISNDKNTTSNESIANHYTTIFPKNFPSENHYYFKNQTIKEKLMIATFRDERSIYDRLVPITDPSDKMYTYLGKHSTYVFNNKSENKKVVLIGDSFAEMVIFRIKHLYDMQKIKNFPTVIFKVVSGSWISFHCEDEEYIDHNLKAHLDLMEFLKKEKPMSVLFISKPYTGIYPEIINDDELPDKNGRCIIKSKKDPSKFSRLKVEDLMNKFSQTLKSLSDMGMRVYMNTLKPEGKYYNPLNMFNDVGVIESNIQPMSYSKYMEKYKDYKDIVDNAIEKSGAIKLDFSDNMCKNHECPVIDMDGFAVNRDDTHLSENFVKKYLDVLDKVFIE